METHFSSLVMLKSRGVQLASSPKSIAQVFVGGEVFVTTPQSVHSAK